MRAIPDALEAALASGTTTLCRCWQIERADGLILGFTDHDRDIAFDGVTHKAMSGLSAGALDLSTGLSVDTQTVTGALNSARLSERDLELGLYDSAGVRVWLVDWQDPESRLLLSAGTIGEVRRSGGSFEAEVVGLAERLNRPFGRAFTHGCDRRLGDERCKVDLSDPAFHAIGTVLAVTAPGEIEAEGLGAFAPGWFEAGRLVWLSGANAGAEGQVKRHAPASGAVLVETWLTPPFPVAPGDRFRIEAGCDRRLETCRDRFANLLNFRGFPHLPGDDFAVGYPMEGGGHDGGSLFR